MTCWLGYIGAVRNHFKYSSGEELEFTSAIMWTESDIMIPIFLNEKQLWAEFLRAFWKLIYTLVQYVVFFSYILELNCCLEIQ